MKYAPDGYRFYSVVTTNGWNLEYMLPTDEDARSRRDHQRMRALEDAAEHFDTSVRSFDHALLT